LMKIIEIHIIGFLATSMNQNKRHVESFYMKGDIAYENYISYYHSFFNIKCYLIFLKINKIPHNKIVELFLNRNISFFLSFSSKAKNSWEFLPLPFYLKLLSLFSCLLQIGSIETVIFMKRSLLG